MKIAGIAASEHIDSSGEILRVEGADIQSFNNGTGVFNFEHTNDDAEDVVGRIHFGKKIFSEDDCDTPLQLKFWQHVKCPYIYVEGELFDDDGHPGAVAIAAMMRYYKRTGEPMLVGMSIEGSTTQREGNVLQQTVARRVALTLKPCNKSCISDMLAESPDIKKALGDNEFRPLSRGFELDFEESVIESDPLQEFVEAFAEFRVLKKTLTAGMPSGAPGTVTGGATLQAGTQEKKKKKKLSRDEMFSATSRMRAAIRDRSPGQSPMDAIKAELPNLGPQFIEHFDDVVQDLSLQKSRRDIVAVRDVPFHVPHSNAQKALVAGIRAMRLDAEPRRTINSKGLPVLVRKSFQAPHDRCSHADRAVAYFNMARDFFGLGAHVPLTASFHHPHDRSAYFVEEWLGDVMNGHAHAHGSQYDAAIRDAASSGLLHRLIIMDYVLGHGERSAENLLVSPSGQLHAVDNHDSFGQPAHPELIHLLEDHQRVIPYEVCGWLASMSVRQLVKYLLFNGIPKSEAGQAAQRLEEAKRRVRDFMTLDALFEDVPMSLEEAANVQPEKV